MPDNRAPVKVPSSLEIEAFSEKDDYLDLLDRFEKTALSVLSEPGVADHLRIDEELPVEFQHLYGRAIKAVHALSSVRMLRKWQAEAELDGNPHAERFYHIAHRAFVAAMATTMVAPTFTGFEATEAKLAKGRSKGGDARQEPFKIKSETIRTELKRLWSGGARFTARITWSEAVVSARPELTPATDKGWDRLNRKVSEIGHNTFGDDWPI